MVGRYIQKLGLWFALLVIVAANISALLLITGTVPKTQAADDPDAACTAAADQGILSFSTASFNDDPIPPTKVKLALTLVANSSLRGNPTATLYRKKSSENAYRKIADVSLTRDQATGRWDGSYTDEVGENQTTLYFLLANATNALSQPISKCFRHTASLGGGGGGGFFSLESAKQIFRYGLENSDIAGLEITTFETKNNPPKVFVSKDKLAPGLQRDFTFKLVAHSGEGAVAITNVDWLTFQGYYGEEKFENLYFVVSDNLDANFYYSTDYNELKKGHLDTAGTTRLTRAVAREGDAFEKSLGKYFTYVMNVPIAADGSIDPSNNCVSSPKKKVTGPKNDSAVTPAPDIKNTTEASVDGTRARLLSQHCVNITGNGWLKYWNVTDLFSATPGGAGLGCGLAEIVVGGIDQIFVKIISCTVQGLFTGIIEPLVKAGQSIGNETDQLEQQLKNGDNRLVAAWRYSLSLINIIVILALLAIAFANILHLNINTYAAKKALPGLVLGVIGANASMLLIRFVLDVAQALMSLGYSVVDAQGMPDLIRRFVEMLGLTATSNTYVVIGLGIFALFIMIVFIVYMLLLMAIFTFALIKRLVLIYVLIILAPLAFVAYGVPSMQQWFGKWWDMFIRQVFLLPIIVLAMALLIKYSVALGFSIDADGIRSESATSILHAVIILVAATLILKLPNIITKGAIDVTAAAKKAFGYAKGAPTSMYGGAQGVASGFSKRNAARASLLAPGAEKDRLLGKAAKWKSASGAFAAARGRSYIAANPEKTAADWWKKRTELGEKESKKQATMANYGTPKIKIAGKNFGANFNLNQALQGGPGAYDSAKDWAGELANKASSIDEANDILTKGGKAKNIAAAFRTHEDSLQFERDKGGNFVLDAGGNKKVLSADETNLKRKSFRGRVIALLQGNLDDVEKLMNEAAVPLEERGSAWDRGLVAAHYKAKQRVLQSEATGDERKRVLTTTWDEANSKTPPPAPFGGGMPTPGTSSPKGPSAGNASSQAANNPNLTINAGKVDVNTDTEVNIDPNVAARFGRLKDLAGAIKNPTQKQKEDGEMETPDEAESRHIGGLKDLSSEWGEFATKNLGSLSTEEPGQLDNLRARTSQAFDDTIDNGALRAGAEQLLSSADAGTLEQLTDGLAEVVQHRNILQQPASLERLIANRSAISQQADALNQAGGQFIAGQDIDKLIQAINSQPEAVAQQIEALAEPHYREMTQALNRQDSAGELQKMTRTLVANWKNTVSGRDPRSVASILSRSVATLGDTFAKDLSYGQLNPTVNVKVEPGKPNVIIQPPATQLGDSTTINNNTISNQTTEIGSAIGGPSTTTESIAKRLGETESQPGPTEIPPTEPPAPSAP